MRVWRTRKRVWGKEERTKVGSHDQDYLVHLNEMRDKLHIYVYGKISYLSVVNRATWSLLIISYCRSVCHKYRLANSHCSWTRTFARQFSFCNLHIVLQTFFCRFSVVSQRKNWCPKSKKFHRSGFIIKDSFGILNIMAKLSSSFFRF